MIWRGSIFSPACAGHRYLTCHGEMDDLLGLSPSLKINALPCGTCAHVARIERAPGTVPGCIVSSSFPLQRRPRRPHPSFLWKFLCTRHPCSWRPPAILVLLHAWTDEPCLFLSQCDKFLGRCWGSSICMLPVRRDTCAGRQSTQYLGGPCVHVPDERRLSAPVAAAPHGS